MLAAPDYNRCEDGDPSLKGGRVVRRTRHLGGAEVAVGFPARGLHRDKNQDSSVTFEVSPLRSSSHS